VNYSTRVDAINNVESRIKTRVNKTRSSDEFAVLPSLSFLGGHSSEHCIKSARRKVRVVLGRSRENLDVFTAFCSFYVWFVVTPVNPSHAENWSHCKPPMTYNVYKAQHVLVENVLRSFFVYPAEVTGGSGVFFCVHLSSKEVHSASVSKRENSTLLVIGFFP